MNKTPPTPKHPSRVPGCLLCSEPGGEILWRDQFARVVLAGDADHPGLCRAIVNRHAREMTDLDEAERDWLMQIVFAVEAAQRALLSAEKINLASLGNQVAHVHWHIIPRFRGDPHFPNPVWGARTSGNICALPEGFAASIASALDRALGR